MTDVPPPAPAREPAQRVARRALFPRKVADKPADKAALEAVAARAEVRYGALKFVPDAEAAEPPQPEDLARSVVWQELAPAQNVPTPLVSQDEPRLEEVPAPAPRPAPAPPARPLPARPLPSSVAGRAPNQVDPGLRPIGSVGINIAQPRPENMTPDGIDLPDNLAAAIIEEAGSQRFETEPFKPWGAYGQLAISSNFCHRPLYFEDVNLERYGRSWGAAQPFVSAGKFFATVPLLPYKMVREPPHVCQADVGPPAGTPAPRQRVVGPLEVDAALVEAAVVVGLILLIP